MVTAKTIPLSHSKEIMAMLLFNSHRCMRFPRVFKKHSHVTLNFLSEIRCPPSAIDNTESTVIARTHRYFIEVFGTYKRLRFDIYLFPSIGSIFHDPKRASAMFEIHRLLKSRALPMTKGIANRLPSDCSKLKKHEINTGISIGVTHC